jgi:primosomal protein N'
MGLFCNYCNSKLINKNCPNCLNNSNALKEFEEEND